MGKPTAYLTRSQIDAIVGSIIQLDGRNSSDPDNLPLTFTWKLVSAPLGTALVVGGDASFKDLRPSTKAAVSFVPDKLGPYVVELKVSNGTTLSDPVTVVVNIGLSKVPVGEGIVPDASFLWDVISDFWALVEDREALETIWSAAMQVLSADLLKLWSNDYDKALTTIQSVVQRRWQRVSMRTRLSGTPQSVIVGNTRNGTNGKTGATVSPVSGKTNIFHVLFNADLGQVDPDFAGIDINYGAQGRILLAGAEAGTIERVFVAKDQLTNLEAVFLLTGSTYTDVTTKAASDVDNATLFGALDDYLYLGSTSPFTEVRFDLVSVASVALATTKEYSTASGWSTLAVTDGTASFTNLTGSIKFTAPTDWATKAVNSKTMYWVRLKRTTVSVTAPVEKQVRLFSKLAAIELAGKTLTSAQGGLSWRIPHLLHTPLIDLQAEGVRAGDILVLEFTRRDTGISAEIKAQVVAVNGTRLGFEFSLNDLAAGGSDFDHALFRQLVQDLKLILPSAAESSIAATAEALISFIPPGVNLAARPFTPYTIFVRAKEVIRNRAAKLDPLVSGVPVLQEKIKNPKVVYEENRDFVVLPSLLSFQSSTFTLKAPSPIELWAEVMYVDNNQVVESHFGRQVGLLKDSLDLKDTRPPYVSAVRGLWYAAVGGPTMANIRLGAQVLLGLPFTEARGLILDHIALFSKDAAGNDLGRLLLEDVDEQGARLGIRRVYLYPTNIGLEINPSTGKTIAIGDTVDRFTPLCRGIEVEDYVKNPQWWSRSLAGMEVAKLFTFKVALDAAAGVFSLNDFQFMIRFVGAIKPVYTRLLASVIRQLYEDIPITDQVFGAGSEGLLRYALYDNPWGNEATLRTDDHNHQGALLTRFGSHPFSTRTTTRLTDVQTRKTGSTVEALSTGFAKCRARVVSGIGVPTIEGDLLVIAPGQPGAGISTPGVYEITSLNLAASPAVAVLGHQPPAQDPVDFLLNPPDANLFVYGTGLRATVLRRSLNPIMVGTDLEVNATTLGIHARITTGDFLLQGVSIDDHLIIESGPQEGEYRIDAIDSANDGTANLTRPASYFSATIVALRQLGGASPVFSAQTGLSYRVIRPYYLRKRYVGLVDISVAGGDVFLNVNLPGIPGRPIDMFTPGMVGSKVVVFNSVDSVNNGAFTILEYIHAGSVKIQNALAISGTGVEATVTTQSLWHHGYENIAELGPFEAITSAVSV